MMVLRCKACRWQLIVDGDVPKTCPNPKGQSHEADWIGWTSQPHGHPITADDRDFLRALKIRGFAIGDEPPDDGA